MAFYDQGVDHTRLGKRENVNYKYSCGPSAFLVFCFFPFSFLLFFDKPSTWLGADFFIHLV